MTMRAFRWSLVLALCLAAAAAGAQPVVSYVKQGARFEEVRDDLRQAIESRGLVLDYQSHIGTMLERTGKDLGSGPSPFVDAQVLQFCSAAATRAMVQADPANVVLCPYSIAVYATRARPDQVVVSYRRPTRPGAPASRAALREVERLIDGIAREAAGRK
jgi:uncharacterized protein (DUF302 family)